MVYIWGLSQGWDTRMGPDISSRSDAGWLVVGWFTPDYRPVAERFAHNLNIYNAPHQLYAVESFGRSFVERTRKKPEIVLRALSDFPDKTIVLMDVDSIVSGDIEPVTDILGDVGVIMKARQEKLPRLSLAASSRIMVFRPTADARRFAEAWKAICADPAHSKWDDELCLAWTFVTHSDVRCQHIPVEYSARGMGECKNQVISHKSENAVRSNQGFSVRRFLKSVEKRLFRTGRSALWKEMHDRQLGRHKTAA